MENRAEKGCIRNINIEEILFSKNPSLSKIAPGFAIDYLKKIVHQEEINNFLKVNGELRDTDFIEAGLRYLNIRYNVFGKENIPQEGRYIFVSNHPLGGLDGLIFINEISKYFRDVKFPVNDILMNIENLSGIFLPINKHGRQDKDAAHKMEDAFASDCQILYFPAGLCSRKKNGIIKDLQWHKNFITKALKHKRDIVPAFFSGKNSDFFYRLSNIRKSLGIKANIEMLYLADEMFKQKEKKISLVFGKAISWQAIDNSKSAPEWADWIKSKTYELESCII